MNHQEFEDKLLDQTVGQTIRRVTYFEINDPEGPVTFNEFDCFDLGIEIQLSNGFQWHVSWKNFGFIQMKIGPSRLHYEYDAYAIIDATDRWEKYTSATIAGLEIVYLNEEWRLPSRCIISFSDGKTIQIVIGQELNLDGTLPALLEFVEPAEIYVFYGEILTDHTDVTLILEPYAEENEELSERNVLHDDYFDEIILAKKRTTPSVFTGLFMLFVIAVFILIWLRMH